MANNPKLVKQIREIVKSEYDYWLSYNDPIKEGRKLKFMQNGYIAPASELSNMKGAIVKKLKDAGIDVMTAGWETCSSWRGDYNAFIVRISC